MLDEFLEYEEYQFHYYDKNPDKPFRITLRNMGNDFTGVPRALEIIARHQIFKDEIPIDICSNSEQIKENLVSWLDKLKKSDSLHYLYLHRKKKANGDDIYQALDDYIEHYKVLSIERKFKNYKRALKHSDLNASFFDKTIACAYNRGSLKKYMLVQEGNPFVDVYRREDRNTKPTSLNAGKKMFDHRDYILKFTAYYLLENSLNQQAVALNKLLLHNWSKYVGEVRYYYEDPDKQQHDLFTEIPVFDRCNKYIPYKPWISKFSLEDITEPGKLEKWLHDPQNINKTYYIDKGAHENLECHVVADEI